ncbi:MAG TPA: helicase, partial [Pirellulaceae bacterium]|nr:helicase [Pirellulaceae bacterium]
LGADGRIAARLSRYEMRPEQLELADAVAAALAKGRHLIAEAGTGVGKSFGYLVPAILHVTADEGGGEARAASGLRGDDEGGTKRRIIVSTHTISLQEQLLAKDLPLLRSVIPREFTAVLVKGRGNYLSRRRLEAARARSASLFQKDEEFDQLRRIAQWVDRTGDGTLSDLGFRPMPSIWDEVQSDSGNCLGRNCPHHKECFYFRARRRAINAQILVVNHALFFSDLSLRRANVSLLPDYDAVIFDEAHTLEAVAGEHLGLGVTSGQVQFTLNKLYNQRTEKGLLVHHQLEAEKSLANECQLRSDDFFDSIYMWLQEGRNRNGRVREPQIVPNDLSPALMRL